MNLLRHLNQAAGMAAHILRNRPWLVVAIGLGLITWLALPASLHPRARILLAWNVTQWFYIGRILLLMHGATAERIRSTAERYDESAEVVLSLVSIASVIAVGVIFLEVVSGKGVPGVHQVARIGLPFVTLAGTWLLVPLLFAVNYAHDWYCAPEKAKPLRFPDDIECPSYCDFAYCAITIAVASQTSDVAVTGSAARRLVMVQSVLSFVFNTSILGLTINLAASVLS